jgi:hypothetical protein
MSLNDRIKTESKDSGRLFLIYGQSGVGKTSCFCQAPRSLLIEVKDSSSGALKSAGSIRQDLPVIETENWDDLLEVLVNLSEESHEYKSVVIDGASGAEEFCNHKTVQEDCDGSTDKFLSFGRGDRLSAIRWQELVEKLNNIKKKGIWIFFLAHQSVVTITNPSGDNFIKYQASLAKEKLASINKYSDAILFFNFLTFVKDSQNGKGKALGGEKRVAYASPSASFDAKNRINLPSMIELGNSASDAWNSFSNAVKQGRVQKSVDNEKKVI